MLTGCPSAPPGRGWLEGAALLLALSDLVRDPAHWRKTDHGAAVRVPTGATVADLIPSPVRETQQL